MSVVAVLAVVNYDDNSVVVVVVVVVIVIVVIYCFQNLKLLSKVSMSALYCEKTKQLNSFDN